MLGMIYTGIIVGKLSCDSSAKYRYMYPTRKSYVPMYHRITSNSHIVVASQISKMAKLKKKPPKQRNKQSKAKENVGIHIRKKKYLRILSKNQVG